VAGTVYSDDLLSRGGIRTGAGQSTSWSPAAERKQRMSSPGTFKILGSGIGKDVLVVFGRRERRWDEPLRI
jgi:hypothetical protein